MTKAVLIILPPSRDTLSGFSDGMRGRRLKADGFFHEIISWKLRIFAPNEVSGLGVLANVLERDQVDRVCSRVAR
jgi:hypothetical protein